MYKIYTDGSSSDDKAASVAIIITPEQRAITVKAIPARKDSYYAEVYAILAALEQLSLLNTKGSEIEVITDNHRAVHVLREYSSNLNNASNLWLWRKIFKLIEGNDWYINPVHIKSHQVKFNKNKTCDLLAKQLRG